MNFYIPPNTWLSGIFYHFSRKRLPKVFHEVRYIPNNTTINRSQIFGTVDSAQTKLQNDDRKRLIYFKGMTPRVFFFQLWLMQLKIKCTWDPREGTWAHKFTFHYWLVNEMKASFRCNQHLGVVVTTQSRTRKNNKNDNKQRTMNFQKAQLSPPGFACITSAFSSHGQGTTNTHWHDVAMAQPSTQKTMTVWFPNDSDNHQSISREIHVLVYPSHQQPIHSNKMFPPN